MNEEYFSTNAQVGAVLLGWNAYVYSYDNLNELCSILHDCDGHKGVVVSSCNPWVENIFCFL
jgi:hypothetical protein